MCGTATNERGHTCGFPYSCIPVLLIQMYPSSSSASASLSSAFSPYFLFLSFFFSPTYTSLDDLRCCWTVAMAVCGTVHTHTHHHNHHRHHQFYHVRPHTQTHFRSWCIVDDDCTSGFTRTAVYGGTYIGSQPPGEAAAAAPSWSGYGPFFSGYSSGGDAVSANVSSTTPTSVIPTMTTTSSATQAASRTASPAPTPTNPTGGTESTTYTSTQTSTAEAAAKLQWDYCRRVTTSPIE